MRNLSVSERAVAATTSGQCHVQQEKGERVVMASVQRSARSGRFSIGALDLTTIEAIELTPERGYLIQTLAWKEVRP